MSLQQRIDSDLKDAMRAKDATRLGVLRMLKSALKYAAIEKSGAEAELADAESIQVIRKQAKQRQDSIESFEKGGRPELAAKEKEELKILSGYLPQQLSADELSQNCARDDRLGRRNFESANGTGDERAADENCRTRRWENAEPGSTAATSVRLNR